MQCGIYLVVARRKRHLRLSEVACLLLLGYTRYGEQFLLQPRFLSPAAPIGLLDGVHVLRELINTVHDGGAEFLRRLHRHAADALNELLTEPDGCALFLRFFHPRGDHVLCKREKPLGFLRPKSFQMNVACHPYTSRDAFVNFLDL